MDGPTGMFEGPIEVGCPQDCDGPQVNCGFPIEGIAFPPDEGGSPQRGLGWLMDCLGWPPNYVGG